MCDCDFKTAAPDTAPLDPRKRVRYFPGLVLGPEEFQQDQLYMMARDRLHQRSLHGYGTVLGLGVEVSDDAGGRPQVVVAPGLAVTPRGDSVCVPAAQCAPLDDWLRAHRDELTAAGSPPSSPPGSPPEEVVLWVVLCHRECETDPVPVLGDPCRTPEEATAPSRIADDFELRLSLVPPPQQEEEAVRLFGALLRSIEVSADAGGGAFLTPDQLGTLVRRLAPSGSPPELPTLAEVLEEGSPALGSPGSPALPTGPFVLHLDDVADALLAAWREWVAHVRPRLAGGAAGCAGGGESCVRLARLELRIAEGPEGLQVDGPVAVDDEDRPWLLHTRLLQEWLGAAWGAAGPPLGSPPLPVPGSPPEPASPPAPASPPILPQIHADLLGLGADDHPQYLLVDPATRALVADLDASGNRVVDLGEAGAPAPGDAVRWDRAVKNGDAAGGDLAGTYPDPQVAALQGSPVSPLAPTAGDLLSWNGAAWVPGPPPPAPAPPVPDLLDEGLVRIAALSWRHGAGFHQLQLTHDGAPARGLALGFGDDAGAPATVQAATLRNRTLLLWARQQAPNSELFHHLEVPLEVVPAQVVATAPDGRILETASDGAAEVSAVVVLVDPGIADALVEARTPLTVEGRGDFILAPDGRAIDAEFARAELPTGDRRSGAALGIQGGRFTSWLTARRLVIGGIDINLAVADELDALPGVGPALAGRIVALRRRLGGIDDLDDLRGAQGISDALIATLRDLIDA